MPEVSLLYEQGQRRRTLAVIIWIVLIASAALGILNIQFRTWGSVIALFSLTLICVPLLWLNATGRFYIAAALLSLIVLAVITYNLFDGDGLRDSGILAYPILILIGTLFFGKRAALMFALASIVSLAAIVYFEMRGDIHPTLGPAEFDMLIPIVILLLVASAMIWVIVGNLEQHLERVKVYDLELHKTYDLTLEAWAKALEFRDKETEGHSRRVTELSIKLAQAMGCGPEEMTQIQRGALLHDIGKLAIPDSILFKSAPLNEQERQIIQQHPTYAKDLLAQIPFLESAAIIPYCHHERWDGTGYPLGLKGEAIPRPARLFALVDQWEALSSDRPYRPAWPREKIIAYVRENSGKIYDPNLVEMFLSIV